MISHYKSICKMSKLPPSVMILMMSELTSNLDSSVLNIINRQYDYFLVRLFHKYHVKSKNSKYIGKPSKYPLLFGCKNTTLSKLFLH